MQSGDETGDGGAEEAVAAAEVQENLLLLARMFEPYREDRLMRELCRLAIKCARERLVLRV